MLQELKPQVDSLKTDYEIIRFVQQPSPINRKTPIWNCYLTVLRKNLLGVIKWCQHPDSRQYCFHPEPDAYYDAKLLKDIRDFIIQLTDLKKQEYNYYDNIY